MSDKTVMCIYNFLPLAKIRLPFYWDLLLPILLNHFHPIHYVYVYMLEGHINGVLP